MSEFLLDPHTVMPSVQNIKEGLKRLNVVRNVSLDFRVDKLSICKHKR